MAERRYQQMLVPVGMAGSWLLRCPDCGAAVLDPQAHDLFHDALPAAVSEHQEDGR